MRIFFLSIVLIVLASCGTIRVNYDYDNKTDFTSYTTYNYFGDMETGLSELDEKRLMNALDATLGEKGFMFAEEPDVFINIKSSVYKTQQRNNVGVGLGGGGGNIGGGVSIGIPVGGPKLNRELQIDFVDAVKDILIWQAISESPFREGDTPEEKSDKLKAVVDKIFSKYPPQ
ncbi:DUF4136 domain-containing protein [Maribacter hydrothermalis]|uniref:DUF4136 domain-containing protein n=1 Tax=Maribacter hydrothermalis TaxID=1836467 RepID=A0A1B7ZFM8_9FLAO|nr:DUF4136 domain-containing protein [Maribacter hydrothermalis]APQ17908.1 hypothetical protein BTR34_11480 [Maribacter hydrothermalis]OBR42379.1 hypothetical protein A9200_03095 [Maribacter hydrothermalis]